MTATGEGSQALNIILAGFFYSKDVFFYEQKLNGLIQHKEAKVKSRSQFSNQSAFTFNSLFQSEMGKMALVLYLK